MRGKRDRPLTRREVLETALEIVDAEGLEALSMRRLAEAVGVEAMSLYRHVPNKEALLELAAELMRSEMRLPDPLPEDWASRMAVIFTEYHRILAAHPNMLPLAWRSSGGLAPAGLQFLLAQGFETHDAVALYQTLAAFTIGFSMLSSPAVQVTWAGLPAELADLAGQWSDETCDRALRLLMDGYARKLDGPRMTSNQ